MSDFFSNMAAGFNFVLHNALAGFGATFSWALLIVFAAGILAAQTVTVRRKEDELADLRQKLLRKELGS